MPNGHLNNLDYHRDFKQPLLVQRPILHLKQHREPNFNYSLQFLPQPVVAQLPIIYEFSDYTNHLFNSIDPASFRYEGVVYKPTKKLGSGVFGEAWLCTSSDPSQSLVLKREIPNYGLYSQGDNFKKEAAFNKQIYGRGETSGNPKDKTHAHYLVMDFIDGMTLRDTLVQFTKYPPASHKEILRVWILFAAAILDFHKHNLVHGDLHSGNAIVSLMQDLVKLIDYGYTVEVGELRRDCEIATKKIKYYPFRPPETFSNLKNPLVYADQNQDIWSAGYHLSKVKKLCDKLFVTEHSRLNGIISGLGHLVPTNRMPLDLAICKVISAYFQEGVRSMPTSFTPEWVIIVAAIIQMRLNELFVAITQTPTRDKKENEANTLADNKAQYEELEKLLIALKADAHELTNHSSKSRHEKFFDVIKATTHASCPFLPGAETIRLMRNTMTSFFPALEVAGESVTTQRQTRSNMPLAGIRPPQPRASTPPVLTRARQLLPPDTRLFPAKVPQLRANTPPAGVRPKQSRLNPHMLTLVPMRF